MSDPGWQELHYATTRERVEALEDYLFGAGAVAVTLQDDADQPVLEPGPGETPLWDAVQVIALFPAQLDLADVRANLPTDLVQRVADEVVQVPEQDWERAWMENFHPMQMGARLWIVPSWTAPPDPSAVNILLDPGLAFGTGTHPTTAMCLGELDRIVASGDRVIDYGCGTGILAIAALKLGARDALGIDNDPQAILASRQNAERNGIPEGALEVSLPQADVLARWQDQADIVVANILAGPLADLAPTITESVRPGGRVVLAGLLADQAADLIAIYAPTVELSIVREIDGWVLLAGNRQR